MKIVKKMNMIILSLIMCFMVIPQIEVSAATNPYARTYISNGKYLYNCTWYAWQRVFDTTGVELPRLGNAANWYNGAIKAGFATGQTPKKNSIMVWGNGYGHVAFLESYDSEKITFSEGGYNWGVTEKHTETLTPSEIQYRNGQTFLGYIYPIGDTDPTPTPDPIPVFTPVPVEQKVYIQSEYTEGSPIQISWTPIPRSLNYAVIIYQNDAIFQIHSDLRNVLSYTIYNLPAGNRYKIVVEGGDAIGYVGGITSSEFKIIEIPKETTPPIETPTIIPPAPPIESPTITPPAPPIESPTITPPAPPIESPTITPPTPPIETPTIIPPTPPIETTDEPQLLQIQVFNSCDSHYGNTYKNLKYAFCVTWDASDKAVNGYYLAVQNKITKKWYVKNSVGNITHEDVYGIPPGEYEVFVSALDSNYKIVDTHFGVGLSLSESDLSNFYPIK